MPGLKSEEKAVIKYKKYDRGQNPACGRKVSSSVWVRSLNTSAVRTSQWAIIAAVCVYAGIPEEIVVWKSGRGPDYCRQIGGMWHSRMGTRLGKRTPYHVRGHGK